MKRAKGIHYRREDLKLKPERPGASYWAVALEKTMLSYFEVEPRTRFETHSHEGEQLTMVLEGELYFEVEGRTSCVRAGEVFAVPAGLPHAVLTREKPARAVDAWSPVPPEYRDSRSYFDAVATQWDAMRKEFFSERVREKAYDLAKIETGKRAADIGAGSGFLTEGLLDRGLNVIAVDQAPAMLAEIRKKFGAKGALDCRIGSAEELPIENASVDYVFANMFLHHVESPERAIREMARILKNGGKLIVTDLDEHRFEFLKVEHHDRWMGFRREDVRRWFEEAGLKNVRVDCAGESCCGKSADGETSAQIGIFAAYGEK